MNSCSGSEIARIAIFDSGVGGLTVAREIMKLLPEEGIIYLGDTARVPYGTKSKRTVTRFSSQALCFLLNLKVKLIVIACNTVSALSLRVLMAKCPFPIIGVLEPGARKGVQATRNRIIGIIGTEATIHSGAYSKIINSLDPKIRVIGKSCPLLVPLVEEGWFNHRITYEVISIYLKPLLRQEIDTLILGCTHYPVLRGTLQKVVGDKIALIDSAQEVAREVKRVLWEHKLQATRSPRHDFFVSDRPGKFIQLTRTFLGSPIKNVHRISLDSSETIQSGYTATEGKSPEMFLDFE